jgi:hypothetical protein
MKIAQGALKRDRRGVTTERTPGGEGRERTVRPDPAAERAADEAAMPKRPPSSSARPGKGLQVPGTDTSQR